MWKKRIVLYVIFICDTDSVSIMECYIVITVVCSTRGQNFQLVSVPKDQYGCFFDGDSYLILAVSLSSSCRL